MRLSEVLNTKAIAGVYTEVASNAVPFVGERFFPSVAHSGIDLKWIKSSKGLPVTLAASAYDTMPTIRARGNFSVEKTQMPFFRESMYVGEVEELEIERVQSTDDPYLESALMSIYDDTNNLLSGAEVVAERMRMQLLAAPNGHPSISVGGNGVVYNYNYDSGNSYSTNNYKAISGSTLKWSAGSTAKPLDDLRNAAMALRAKGHRPKYVLMSPTTFGYLLASAQVQSVILSQNVSANVYITDAVVTSVISNITGLDVIVYDKWFVNEAGVDTAFYPDGQVTILPEGAVGKTFFGDTPEARTARQVADVDVSIYGKGIAIAKKVEYGPPAKTSITASLTALPSFEGMDATYVIKVV